jgi:hypothetical protein
MDAEGMPPKQLRPQQRGHAESGLCGPALPTQSLAADDRMEHSTYRPDHTVLKVDVDVPIPVVNLPLLTLSKAVVRIPWVALPLPAERVPPVRATPQLTPTPAITVDEHLRFHTHDPASPSQCYDRRVSRIGHLHRTCETDNRGLVGCRQTGVAGPLYGAALRSSSDTYRGTQKKSPARVCLPSGRERSASLAGYAREQSASRGRSCLQATSVFLYHARRHGCIIRTLPIRGCLIVFTIVVDVWTSSVFWEAAQLAISTTRTRTRIGTQSD